MWKQAIKRHQELIRRNPNMESWSDNIVAASRDLTTPDDWKAFYQYLTYPNRDISEFEPDFSLRTLGDLSLEEIAIPSLPEELEEVCYKNGTDTIIIVQKKNQNTSEDDEKTPI